MGEDAKIWPVHSEVSEQDYIDDWESGLRREDASVESSVSTYRVLLLRSHTSAA